MTAPTKNDELAVALIALASGVLAALAGVSPTGSAAVDVVFVAVSVGLVTWVAAACPPVLAGGAALAAGALSGSPWLAVLSVGAFGVAVWMGGRDHRQIVSAALTLVAMNIAARGSLDWFLGAETVVAAVLAVVLVIAGLRSRSSHSRWIVAGVITLYALAAIVGTASTAWIGARGADDLQSADRAVDGALDLIISGDTDGARKSLETAIARLSSFESSMENPLTSSAAIVPVVAQHRQAALEVARGATDAMTSIASGLDAFDINAVMSGPGTIDIEAVRLLERSVVDFQSALRDVTETVDTVRSPWLVDKATDQLDELDLTIEAQLRRGDDALDVIRAAPALLGSDGPRTYFLAFTTPAEVRGLGGFMGLYAEITAHDGHIEMTQFGRVERLARQLEEADERSVVDYPDEWFDRYSRFGFADTWSAPGTGPGNWGNVTMSPDSAATGEVIAQLYPSSGGRELDGVFAVDVTAMSRLLSITGPVVTTAGVTLDADNAEEFLLNGQYGFSDRPGRADLLEEVAQTVVDKLLGGSLPPPRAMLEALGPMVEEGRLVGWAAADDEQALYETIGLDGGWPDSAEGDAVAVAFNNSAANKLDYFLRARATYDMVVDAATSTASGTMTVELENRPPPKPQPDYVTANGIGLPRGHNRTWVSIFTRVAPTGLTVDGKAVPWDAETEAGFFVSSTFVTMAPGDLPVIEVTLEGPVDLANDAYDLTIWAPPTAKVTPLTANVEVRQLDGSISRATQESLSGAATLVVPLAEPD